MSKNLSLLSGYPRHFSLFSINVFFFSISTLCCIVNVQRASQIFCGFAFKFLFCSWKSEERVRLTSKAKKEFNFRSLWPSPTFRPCIHPCLLGSLLRLSSSFKQRIFKQKYCNECAYGHNVGLPDINRDL